MLPCVRLAPTAGGEGEGDLGLQEVVVDGLEAGLTLSAIDRECSSSCGRRQEDKSTPVASAGRRAAYYHNKSTLALRHLSNRWVGVAMKTKKNIKFNFGQEHREGGGQVNLSKIKKYAKNMVKVAFCLFS